MVPDKLYFPLAPEITIIVAPSTREITGGSSDRKASKEGYTKENYYVCTLADNHEITHILHITLFLTYNVNIKYDVSQHNK